MGGTNNFLHRVGDKHFLMIMIMTENVSKANILSKYIFLKSPPPGKVPIADSKQHPGEYNIRPASD